MKSEQVAGFVSESMAGFIGIRRLPLRVNDIGVHQAASRP